MSDLPHYPHGVLQPLRGLSSLQLYALLRLRVDVFVVEQACVYAEVDALDAHPETLHLLHYAHPGAAASLLLADGMQDDVPVLAACARLLAPAQLSSKAEPAPVLIGRVATAENARRQGIAAGMLTFLVMVAQRRWPGAPIELSAQTQAKALYDRLGFQAVSEEYLEDGIPHISMRYCAS